MQVLVRCSCCGSEMTLGWGYPPTWYCSCGAAERANMNEIESTNSRTLVAEQREHNPDTCVVANCTECNLPADKAMENGSAGGVVL